MWLRVEHTTSFTYDAPVTEAYTELRMKPLDAGGQRCSSFRLRTEPAGSAARCSRPSMSARSSCLRSSP